MDTPVGTNLVEPLSLSRRVTSQAVIEQAAIAGAFKPDVLNDAERARQTADYIARRLDAVSTGAERGWTGEPTPDGGLAFTRRLRGVQERHVIDGPLIKSAEARRLDSLAPELQAVYRGPACSRPRTRRRRSPRRPSWSQRSWRPAAKASRSSVTRAWAR